MIPTIPYMPAKEKMIGVTINQSITEIKIIDENTKALICCQTNESSQKLQLVLKDMKEQLDILKKRA